MNRKSLLLLALALIPFVAVGCDKKTGTTKTTPGTGGTTGGSNTPSDSLPSLPSDIPPEIKAAVESAWPKMEAAGAEIEAAFKSAQAARAAGKPPSSADVTRAKNAQAQTEEWAEIWNVLNDLVDDGKISKAAQSKTERFLRAYDQKISAWNKKAKGIKELSTVK